MPEENNIIVIISSAIIPGLGQILLGKVRRGIAILIVSSIFVLLPNLFFSIYPRLTEGFSKAFNNQSDPVLLVIINLFFNLFLFPSIVWWGWQIYDVNNIYKKKEQRSFTFTRKTIRMIIGSVVYAIGLAGALSMISQITAPNISMPAVPQILSNNTILANATLLQEQIRALTSMRLYISNSLYFEIVFIVTAIIGLVILLLGVFGRSHENRAAELSGKQ